MKIKELLTPILFMLIVKALPAQQAQVGARLNKVFAADQFRFPADSIDFKKIKVQKLRSLIFPATMITYGFVALGSKALKNFDNELKEDIWIDHPHRTIKIDNYLQYTPAALVYSLNIIGIKGRHSLRDRTMIYLMSNAMMGITVNSLKMITRVQRPDGFGTNAFPSGHTATAFVSAEFLYQEYKNISPWYGVAGYTMAAATAYLRMYNNRHWFRDLLPGAGIGIVSTKIVYWIYPAVQRRIFKLRPSNTMVMPYYQNGVAGFSLVHTFN